MSRRFRADFPAGQLTVVVIVIPAKAGIQFSGGLRW
jgi:hypothetical protein